MIRKSLSCLIWKHTSLFVCRSPPPVSSFSTSSESKQLCISPTLPELLVHKYNFSPVFASRASVLSLLTTPENADSVLSFFKESGCSNTQLVKIVKSNPRVLASNLEGTIKPKVKFLQDEGFDIVKIISHNPRILNLNVENVVSPSLSVLKGLLGSNVEVAKVLSMTSYILKKNLEKIIVPNVEFLKSRGIPMGSIRVVLTTYPCCLVVKPEILRNSVEKAKEMGLNATSKKFIYAIATIASMGEESWESKLQAFRDSGFSDCEILRMFRNDPRVFKTSVEKIKKVKELLLGTGKFDISSIVDNPLSLGFSIEERYKPRLRILATLESRNLIKEWPSLSMIRSLSDDKFFKRFIGPYSNELRDVCITKKSARAKEETKP